LGRPIEDGDELRFGSPLILSSVHWVEPNIVAEITYLTWTADNLLRHTVYVGLREESRPIRCAVSDCPGSSLTSSTGSPIGYFTWAPMAE
jgi:ATP-dependent DNA ligase